jgi:isopenicillin N synthase-like dioxygenase
MKTFEHIPQLDLSPLWDDSDDGLERVANIVKDIYTTVGFSYLINYQIPKEVTESIYLASKRFHALPLDVKMKIKQNRFFRGYVPVEVSNEAGKHGNQNEAFVITYEVPEDHPDYKNGTYMAGPNQWPEGLPDFKETVICYRDHMLKLAKKLVAVFSIALGLGPNGLDKYFYNPTYVLRLQCYPKQLKKIPDNLYGLAPHTDYGLFTILSQASGEGLEVESINGEWLSVPYVPNTLVLNSGDTLKRLSNNTFRSNPHRVVNRSTKERLSIPFFFEPDMHSIIEVLPNYISEDHPPQYSPIKYGDYLVDRLQGDFGPLSKLG